MIFRIFGPILLTATPLAAEPNLQDMRSSDILAEIDFLSETLPEKPNLPIPSDTTTLRGVSNYLTSESICREFSYQEYVSLVENFKGVSMQPLFERSYNARFNDGCSIDLDNKNIFNELMGNFDEYQEALQKRKHIVDALEIRKQEMMRRTISQGRNVED